MSDAETIVGLQAELLDAKTRLDESRVIRVEAEATAQEHSESILRLQEVCRVHTQESLAEVQEHSDRADTAERLYAELVKSLGERRVELDRVAESETELAALRERIEGVAAGLHLRWPKHKAIAHAVYRVRALLEPKG